LRHGETGTGARELDPEPEWGAEGGLEAGTGQAVAGGLSLEWDRDEGLCLPLQDWTTLATLAGLGALVLGEGGSKGVGLHPCPLLEVMGEDRD